MFAGAQEVLEKCKGRRAQEEEEEEDEEDDDEEEGQRWFFIIFKTKNILLGMKIEIDAFIVISNSTEESVPESWWKTAFQITPVI